MNLFPYKRPTDPEKKRGDYGSWLDLALQTSVTLAITVAAGFFVGRWLDGLIGTDPAFMIVGTLWGSGMGMYWLIVKVKHYSESQEASSEEDSNPPESK